MNIHPQIDTHMEKYQKWVKKKSELLEEIEQAENELKEIKISEFPGTTCPL